MFRRSCFRSLILIAAGAIAFTSAACGSNTSAAGPGGGGGPRPRPRRDGGAAPVVTSKVVSKDVPVDLAAIGNVEAYATISRPLAGDRPARTTVVPRRRSSSSRDSCSSRSIARPFEAALAQAEANLVRDKALLAQAEAQLARDAANAEYMQLTAERQQQLDERGIISKDIARAGALAGRRHRRRWSRPTAPRSTARKAQLVAQQARGRHREGLSSTTPSIKSPIDGRTGNLGVKVGNLVTANQTELMTIAQVAAGATSPSRCRPIHLGTIKQHMAGGKLPVTATPQDAAAQPATGMLDLRRQRGRHDHRHDQAEGDVRQPRSPSVAGPVRARRRCASRRSDTRRSCRRRRCRPARTASSSSSSRTTRPSSSGRSRSASASTTTSSSQKGLKPGETVVTEGQLRLEPGSRVTTDRPDAAPARAARRTRRPRWRGGASGRRRRAAARARRRAGAGARRQYGALEDR